MKYFIIFTFFAIVAALLGIGVNALVTCLIFIPMGTGYVAWARGHHPLPWFLAGLVIPLLPLYAVILIPENKEVVKQRYGRFSEQKNEAVAKQESLIQDVLKAA